MSIADDQRQFYDELFRRHGDDPRSLSYRDQPTQYERFARLARVFDRVQQPFRVHEIGCGLGHFGDYLAQEHPHAVYSGSDISEEFVRSCRRRFPGSDFELRDVASSLPADRYDFVSLSGTFNPRRNTPPEKWEKFVRDMLRAMYSLSTRGMAANFLTTYHDVEHRDPTLHYEDPRTLIDFVNRDLSRFFSLDAAGPLYEYTLCVYHPEHVAEQYGDSSFERYLKGK